MAGMDIATTIQAPQDRALGYLGDSARQGSQETGRCRPEGRVAVYGRPQRQGCDERLASAQSAVGHRSADVGDEVIEGVGVRGPERVVRP